MVVKELRDSGLPVMDGFPWGTHFCHFYQTRKDFYDTAVPYLKAGMEAGEVCIWITSRPLPQWIWKKFRRLVPNFDDYLTAERLQVVSHEDWYFEGGHFCREDLYRKWLDKVEGVRAAGASGLRAVGDEAWVERSQWKSFMDYERHLDEALSGKPILAMCAYPLRKISGAAIFDISATHQFAMARRDGVDEILEAPVMEKSRLFLEKLVRQRTRELEAVNEALKIEVSQHERAEHALQQIADDLERAQVVAHVGSWTLDIEKNQLRWSKEIYRIFHVPPGQPMTYEKFLACVHPADARMVDSSWQAALKGAPYDIDHRILVGKEVKWVHERAQITFDDRGRPARGIGTVHDITAKKELEIGLKRTNRELRAIRNCNQLLLRAQDEQALLEGISRIICTEAGYPLAWIAYPDETSETGIRSMACAGVADTEGNGGEPYSSLFMKGDVAALALEAIQTNATIRIGDMQNDPRVSNWQDHAKQLDLGSCLVLPLEDSGGRALGAVSIYGREKQAFHPEEVSLLQELAGDLGYGIATLRALQDRREAQENLKTSHDLLSAIINAAPAPIYALDLEGRITTIWNKAAEKLLGWEASDVMGKTLPTVPPGYEDEFKTLVARVESGEILRGIETRRRTRGGEVLDVLLYATPLHDSRGKIMGKLSVLVDITERKRSEASLRILSHAVEQSPITVLITNKQGKIEYANSAFYQITGYTQEEVLGKTPGILKSGETARDEYGRLWSNILAGKTWRGTFRNKKKNEEFYWAESIISPLLDERGRITHFIGMGVDVTEQRRLEELVRQTQKLDAIGRLAGGVAHDFNNMLSVIMGHTELLLAKPQLSEDVNQHLTEVAKAAARSADLTRQLLTFARKQTVSPTVLNLNDIVANMLSMLERLIGEEIELEWNPAQGALNVKIDPSQIDQVLANLCVNARDAITGTGKITISTTRKVYDADAAKERPEPAAGEYAVLMVSDTGCGMDMETQRKLFEPFFTTKETGKGTGLGLATVYGIVKQTHGFITVHSEVNVGTTFQIYLPVSEDRTVSAATVGKHETKSGAGETILVVEDESSILTMIHSMLEQQGYRVLTANSPAEATRLVQAHARELDLLIIDLGLPEIPGDELAHKLVKLSADVPCLYMSGYALNQIKQEEILNNGAAFIQKPFTREGLLAKVKEILPLHR